jgi:hypothetical protein
MLLQVQSATSTQQQQPQQQRSLSSCSAQPEVDREHSTVAVAPAAPLITTVSLGSVLFDSDSIMVDRLYQPHQQQQLQHHSKSNSNSSSTSNSSSSSTNDSRKAVEPVSEGSWDPLLDGLPRTGGRYSSEADDGVVKGLLMRVYRLWSGGRDTSVISGTASPAVSDHI